MPSSPIHLSPSSRTLHCFTVGHREIEDDVHYNGEAHIDVMSWAPKQTEDDLHMAVWEPQITIETMTLKRSPTRAAAIPKRRLTNTLPRMIAPLRPGRSGRRQSALVVVHTGTALLSRPGEK